MESFVFGYFGGRDKKLGAAKAHIRVEPLKLSHDPVNWDELTRKPLLTVSEACLVLNVRVETLRRWVKDGTVTTNRVGKKHLISREFLLNSSSGQAFGAAEALT